VIEKLNPLIRGWANYHRCSVAGRTFSSMSHAIWQMLWQWAKRCRRDKSKRWVRPRYFTEYKNRQWVFAVREKGINGTSTWSRLVEISDIPIRRHVKIRAKANPYDPKCEGYFEAREQRATAREFRGSLRKLWRRQKGSCLVCHQQINSDTRWNVHHVVWRCSAVQTAPTTFPCSTPIVTGKSIADELPSSTGCLRTAPLKGLSRMLFFRFCPGCVYQRPTICSSAPADQLVKDHTTVDQTVVATARTMNVRLHDAAAPREKRHDRAHTSMVEEKLESASGAKFDRLFLQQTSADHDKLIRALKQEREDASDDDIEALIDKILPILEQHKELAQMLLKKEQA
jgi:hypothetical protein